MVQADQIGRTYSPLFTINLPKEEEILDDLKEISAMEYVVQVIMIIVYSSCNYYHVFLLPISCIVRTSHRTNLFVEVTNITKGNSTWAHFTVTGCFPSQI